MNDHKSLDTCQTIATGEHSWSCVDYITKFVIQVAVQCNHKINLRLSALTEIIFKCSIFVPNWMSQQGKICLNRARNMKNCCFEFSNGSFWRFVSGSLAGACENKTPAGESNSPPVARDKDCQRMKGVTAQFFIWSFNISWFWISVGKYFRSQPKLASG